MNKPPEGTPQYLLGIGAESGEAATPLPLHVFGNILRRAGVEYEPGQDLKPSDVVKKLPPKEYVYLPDKLSQMIQEERHGMVLEGKDKTRGMKRIEGIEYLRNWLLERFVSHDPLVIKLYSLDEYRKSASAPQPKTGPFDTLS